jgi:hypothetical protein
MQINNQIKVMRKLKVLKSDTIKSQWLNIKQKHKSGNFDLDEMDRLTCDFVSQLAFLTTKGFDEVDGIKIDTYKDRVWWVIEDIGLLPEYREDEEEKIKEILDTWNSDSEDEFEFEIDDSKFYN